MRSPRVIVPVMLLIVPVIFMVQKMSLVPSYLRGVSFTTHLNRTPCLGFCEITTRYSPSLKDILQEVLPHLNRFSLDIDSARKSIPNGTSIQHQTKDHKHFDSRSQDFIHDLKTISNSKVVDLIVPNSTFLSILSQRVYAIHSNDCESMLRLSITYKDMYALKCLSGPIYDGILFRSSRGDEICDAYDFKSGHFKKTSTISTKTTAHEYKLGYLLVIKDAISLSNGDIVTGKNLIQITRCAIGSREKIPPEVATYNKVFTISQYWGMGYYHFTNEDLPRLILALPFLQKNKDIKIHVSSKNSFVKLLMKQLDISADRLVSGAVRGRVTYVPAGTPCGAASVIPANLLSIVLRAKFKAQYKRDTIVLIKRSHKRWFNNHDSILKMLNHTASKFELKMRVFSDSPMPSFEKTKSMFNRALVIVAPHGAGLSNMLFSQPGTCIIEGLCFDYKHRVNMCYEHLAQILGHVYHGLVPKKQCMQFQPKDILPHVERCLKFKQQEL